ncbi:MAG: hypothetical protein LBG63_02465 [Candidatus Methanoplasma sp.]|jgi:hypothetical protein|nr:hypothetical protein [Candidatus Methanoplasma sp.]
MSGQTLFFTDEPIDGLATFIKGGKELDYIYKNMRFGYLYFDNVIPGLVQYVLWQGAPVMPIFDLAKDYLRKGGETFIVIEVCQGYPTPSHMLMPETVLDLKDHISETWPRSLLDSLPDEPVEPAKRRHEIVKGVGEFLGPSYSKKNPYLEWFTKYRLIDTGVQQRKNSI